MIILTDFHSFTVNEDKLQNQSIWRFLLSLGYPILVKIWKWWKLLNSVPFMKKTLVNHVYIRIGSFWLTFTVSQQMKTNFKISQFSRFLLRPGYSILVNIWKWLKLLNCVPFINETLVTQVYILIWSFWLTSTVLQWMKRNFKICQFWRFLLRSEYANQVKIWKWPNFLILSHSSRKYLEMKFTFEFDHFDWLSQFYSEWRKTSKISQLEDFC